MYSDMGRPSIPPEQLLRALLLQSLYTVRSERLLMEEIDYSVLFRWFVGLGMDDPIWSPTTFSKNRDRLLEGDIAAAFFDAVVAQARAAGLLSDEHFTVDGTLLEAGAGLKSFRRKDEGPTPPPDLFTPFDPIAATRLAPGDFLQGMLHSISQVFLKSSAIAALRQGAVKNRRTVSRATHADACPIRLRLSNPARIAAPCLACVMVVAP
jgi:transposase